MIDDKTSWRPTASLERLRQRAKLLSRIRHFFSERDVLEVETPLLSHASVTDPHLTSMTTTFKTIGMEKERILYLQTSPEFAMKRLLAAGIGSIYQLSKAFRQDEKGKRHHPEFTILEWYRLNFDHHALMDEMDSFLKTMLPIEKTERIRMADLFNAHLGINPHQTDREELIECAKKKKLSFHKTLENASCTTWLDLLFSHIIEPTLGESHPIFIYDFPVAQAALAKIREEKPPVASRFEVYYKGLELANGFHELQDPDQQRTRFETDLAFRMNNDMATPPMDEYFLAALQHGLPDCAGVALGVDRLLMLALHADNMSDVISFASF